MDRDLLRKTLAEVKQYREGDPCEFTAEKAGILRAFLSARQKVHPISPAEQALHKRILVILRNWEAGDATGMGTAAPPAERRTQHALRDAMDKMQQERWEELTEDEVQLVQCSHEVVSKRVAAGAQESARVLDLMTTLLEKHKDYSSGAETLLLSTAPKTEPGQARRSVFSAEPVDKNDEAPQPRKVKHFITPDEDFWNGRRKQVGNLQGIVTDLLVQVCEFDGETELDGDIPEHALVVVKNGGLRVKGFVAGHVVAAENVEIEGNAQGGWIISRQGDISLNRGLANTKLVSLRGDVSCRYLESPDCVFAWGTVAIEGPLRGGRVTGCRIGVRDEVKSAELHCCGQVKAGSFVSTLNAPAVVCLRESLTCEDYGRPFTREDKALRQRLRHLEIRIATEQELDRHNERLARYCYRTALFYLLGGVGSAASALQFQGIEAKAVHLQQLVGVAEGIQTFYAPMEEDPELHDKRAAQRFLKESLDVLSVIHDQVRDLPDEFGLIVKEFLAAHSTALRTGAERLHKAVLNQRSAQQSSVEFAEKVETWRDELRETEKEIDRTLKKFGVSAETVSLIDRDADALEQLLDEHLRTIQKGGEKSQWQRAHSPLIRVLRDYAQRYRRPVRSKTADARKDLREVRAQLEAGAILLDGQTVEGNCSVQAQHYEPGVVLTATPGLMEGTESSMAEVITISSSIERETSFVLREGKIVRMK